MRKNYEDPIPEPAVDPSLFDPVHSATLRRTERLRSTIRNRQRNLHLVLEDVHDPHNVSAVLRTCDAVGVGTVHLVYVNEKFPRIGRTSSASAYKWTDIEHYTSIAECYTRLRHQECVIYATHLGERSQNLYETDLSGNIALVFGNEHRGLSSEAANLADGNLMIPMKGLIQSLNISVACAVTLYEVLRQRELMGLYPNPNVGSEQIEVTLEEWLKR